MYISELKITERRLRSQYKLNKIIRIRTVNKHNCDYIALLYMLEYSKHLNHVILEIFAWLRENSLLNNSKLILLLFLFALKTHKQTEAETIDPEAIGKLDGVLCWKMGKIRN